VVLDLYEVLVLYKIIRMGLVPVPVSKKKKEKKPWGPVLV
jgi:hypothetical protein